MRASRPIAGTPKRRGRHGVAASELALILPLLLSVVLGAIDLGRFAHTYIAVTNAARSGAGFAAMNSYTTTTKSVWDASLKQVVQDEMQQVIDDASGFSDSDLIVFANRSFDDGSLWRVRVDVTFPFETVVPWPTIPSVINLQRTVEVRGIR